MRRQGCRSRTRRWAEKGGERFARLIPGARSSFLRVHSGPAALPSTDNDGVSECPPTDRSVPSPASKGTVPPRAVLHPEPSQAAEGPPERAMIRHQRGNPAPLPWRQWPGWRVGEAFRRTAECLESVTGDRSSPIQWIFNRSGLRPSLPDMPPGRIHPRSPPTWIPVVDPPCLAQSAAWIPGAPRPTRSYPVAAVDCYRSVPVHPTEHGPLASHACVRHGGATHGTQPESRGGSRSGRGPGGLP